MEVASPFTPGMLSLLRRGVRVVQLATPLTDRDHRRLGSWFQEHPQAALRVCAGGLGDGADLSFLRHYPRLTGLSIDSLDHEVVLGPQSLDHLPTPLRDLRLEARARDLRPLAGVTQLEHLKLRSVTADLAPLTALTRLRTLEIRLGGITDLSVVPEIGRITYLELWLVRGLADVSFLADMGHLEHLFLQALRNVRALPDLSRCTALERVHLETMKGLVDLSALATAPALRQLSLVDVGHLCPEDLLPLKTCGALEELGVGLNSDRKNLAARALLQIPGSYGGHDWP
ncbi:hypothetical protein SAMN06264364_12152 [Quadrisphaera granulorum]|uniref:Leucine rich repeat (LRR) protein n=1 Tax=Quadrisphaera granulorum TaxID=317664 RepID=A0A316A0G5_9ACTN|nr:hypothetical protein BXY45_12152 [Quadrisphaera granulorum]SZE97825.1 hypothetical protein SAMN06264364_12152 [Quadrisphaera granulorum]